MEFGGSHNHYGLDVFALDQRFHTAVEVLDFEFRRCLLGTFCVRVSHSDQSRFRNKAAQILSMLSPHRAHAHYSHAQFRHSLVLIDIES